MPFNMLPQIFDAPRERKVWTFQQLMEAVVKKRKDRWAYFPPIHLESVPSHLMPEGTREWDQDKYSPCLPDALDADRFGPSAGRKVCYPSLEQLTNEDLETIQAFVNLGMVEIIALPYKGRGDAKIVDFSDIRPRGKPISEDEGRSAVEAYKILGTVTGRVSCKEPNISAVPRPGPRPQNIKPGVLPVRTIKKRPPSEGPQLDWSALEKKLMFNIPKMKELNYRQVRDKIDDAQRFPWPAEVFVRNNTANEVVLGYPPHEHRIPPRGSGFGMSVGTQVDLVDLTPSLHAELLFLMTDGKVTVWVPDTEETKKAEPPPKCECGVAACGGPERGPQHSSWCPMSNA